MHTALAILSVNLTHVRENTETVDCATEAKLASITPPIKSVLSPKSSGNNVLVVDDNGVCRVLRRMLSDEQYQVQTSIALEDIIKLPASSFLLILTSLCFLI